jgi:PKD repeat protein
MKNINLLALLLLPALLQAQIRITADQSPLPGNRFVYQIANATNSLNPGAPGAGQNWDFTSFMPTSQEVITADTPENTPGRDSFPTANLVFTSNDGLSFSYALATDTAFFSLGTFVNTGDSTTAFYTVLNPPRKEIAYPTELGSSFQESLREQRMLAEISPGSFLLSITETDLHSSADAEGMMHLPQGDFAVLRIKQQRSQTDSTFLVDSTRRQLINVITTESLTYEWYSPAVRGPLVSLDMANTALDITSISVLDLASSQLSDSTEVVVKPPITAFDTVKINQSTYIFLDQSTNEPNSWHWDFGDGNTATTPNVQHQYQTEGIYTVCLKVSNSAGRDSTCKTITLSGLVPQARFAYTIIEGDSIQLLDNSGNLPTEWHWDFGDGNSSQEQNPGHRYALGGSYAVCLTAKNSFGQDSTCQTIELVLVNSQAEWIRPFIELGPNPFREQLQLNWHRPAGTRPWRYRILTATGRVIQEGRLTPSQIWSTMNWNTGNYWLQIIADKPNTQLSIPLVKQ